MKRLRTSRVGRRRGDEQASAMIIALFFATIFSLLVAEVITFVDVGFKSSRAFERRDREAYAADGAVDYAINRFRTGTEACEDWVAPPSNGKSMLVRCDEIIPAARGSVNKPANALLSLGDLPGEGGISSSSPNLRVRGDIFSNSTVTTTGTMVVEGIVSALGDCDGNGVIQTDPASPLQCANHAGGADPVRGRDPDYSKDLTAVLQRQDVPACPTPDQWLVEMKPGYYDDIAGLNALTSLDGDPACDGAVVWFQPGVYYFNLSFVAGAAGTWTVNEPTVNVVAGTPKGWDPESASRPNQGLGGLEIPGGCKTEGDSGTVKGVQFVFGGQSNLVVDGGGKVEVCAEPTDDSQRIALYGLPTVRPTHILEPTATAGPTAPGVSTFADPDHAVTIGETPPAVAEAVLEGSGLTAASLTVHGFRPTVPAGALIDSGTLRVAHQEIGDIAAGGVSATVSFAGGTCTVPLQIHTDPGQEDVIDLTAPVCGLATAAQFGNLSVTYNVTLDDGGVTATDRLDGIAVDVAWREPVTRRPTAGTVPSGFTSPDNALEIGEQPSREQPGPLTADASLTPDPGGTTSASLTLTGYADPPLMPEAQIDSAVLRVAHQDIGDIEAGGVTVAVDFPGDICTAPLDLGVWPNAIVDDRVDLAEECGFDQPGDLAGLTVTYEVSLDPGDPDGSMATDRLDGIWLELVSTVPVREATAPPVDTGFTNEASAVSIDNVTAEAVLSSSGIASLELSGGFNQPNIPAGSFIDSAVVRVAHRHEGDFAPGEITLTASFTGSACDVGSELPLALNKKAAIAEQRIDLVDDCGLNDPTDLGDLSLTYGATLAPTSPNRDATAYVDGMVLEVTWIPPTVRGPSAVTNNGFSDSDNAKHIDGTAVAHADLADPGLSTASITLGDYERPPLPPGSVIDKVMLRVAHRHQGNLDGGGVSLVAAFTGSECDGAGSELSLAQPEPTIETQVINLVAACALTSPAQLAELTLTYKAALATGGTEADAYLDGMELDIVFRPPAVEPLAGDLVDGPYPITGAALLRVGQTDPSSRFVSQGTVYAPTAALHVSMSGVNSQVFTRGIIARTIQLGLTPEAGFRRATTAVPPEAVLFSIYDGLRRATTVAPSTSFVDADNAKAIDGLASNAQLDAVNSSLAILELSPFDEPSLAETATFEDVVLRIKHREGADVDSLTVTVRLADGTEETVTSHAPCTLCERNGPSGPISEVPEDRIDLDELFPGLRKDQLANVTVTFRADLGSGSDAVVELDGIELDVYSEPVLRSRVSFDRGRVFVEGWSVLRG